MKKVLFYDRYDSGHHIEYLSHILNTLNKRCDFKVYFALNPNAINQLGHLLGQSYKVIEAPDLKTKNKLNREEGLWISTFCKKHAIDHLFFMSLDEYQYIIGTALFRNLDTRVSGIVFSPPHRISRLEKAGVNSRVSALVKRYRKIIQYQWLFRNKHIGSIFVLDDNQLESLCKISPVFKYLPDPVFSESKTVSSEAVISEYRLNDNDVVFLSFGSIIPRKNLDELIKAFGKINNPAFKLLIIGKGSEAYVGYINDVIYKYFGADTDRILINNSFVSQSEMDALFDSVDFICMTYTNFYGSSGVLGRSAYYNKYVLASRGGLVEFLVKKYQLGVCVGEDYNSIADGINTLLENCHTFAPLLRNKYLERKTPSEFAEAIIKSFS